MVCRTPSETDGNMLFEHLGEADHTFRHEADFILRDSESENVVRLIGVAFCACALFLLLCCAGGLKIEDEWFLTSTTMPSAN